MKTLIIVYLAFLSSYTQVISQNVVIDKQGFETFIMQDEDTTYVMKKYFMAFLKSGQERNQSTEEIARIQAGHMAHIEDMAKKKQICIAGPFGDDGDMKGILIFNVPTIEEVDSLVAQDPAVIAGRLVLEVHPWWAAQGSTLE